MGTPRAWGGHASTHKGISKASCGFGGHSEGRHGAPAARRGLHSQHGARLGSRWAKEQGSHYRGNKEKSSMNSGASRAGRARRAPGPPHQCAERAQLGRSRLEGWVERGVPGPHLGHPHGQQHQLQPRQPQVDHEAGGILPLPLRGGGRGGRRSTGWAGGHAREGQADRGRQARRCMGPPRAACSLPPPPCNPTRDSRRRGAGGRRGARA